MTAAAIRNIDYIIIVGSREIPYECSRDASGKYAAAAVAATRQRI